MAKKLSTTTQTWLGWFPTLLNSIWGSLHFLPLVLNVFISRYDSDTFLSHLTEGEYGFDCLGANCINLYQMYLVVPTVRGGIPYVGIGLLYRSSNLHVGSIEDCTIFLKAFFSRCGNKVDVAPSQAFFLCKRCELGPLCWPLPSWLCIDTMTPCLGIVAPEKTQARAIHSTSTLTFRLLLATTHWFEGIEEKASVFIPFKDDQDIRPLW